MQMRLPVRLRISNPLLQHILRLLDKLAVQVNRIAVDSAHGVVLAEDEVGRLLVILVHQLGVALAFFAEVVRCGAVAAHVCTVRLRGERSLGEYVKDSTNAPGWFVRGGVDGLCRSMLRACRALVLLGLGAGRILARRRRCFGRG